jgi:hypothetical protein
MTGCLTAQQAKGDGSDSIAAADGAYLRALSAARNYVGVVLPLAWHPRNAMP